MRFLHHINLAIKEGSFRRISRILRIRSLLETRRQEAELPDWLKRNWQSTPSLGEAPGTYRFDDVTRIHTADGEIYIFSDGCTIDCRKKNDGELGVSCRKVPMFLHCMAASEFFQLDQHGQRAFKLAV